MCSQGFFLPATAITDQDEKILFDVEVKLKLKHASARNQLWTIVADFPPSVLLQRQELLIALLNGIGAPFSHEDVLVDPLGLHAIGCLRVFRLLLSKVRSEVSVFFDWGLVNEGHLEGRKRQLEHTVSLRYPTLRLGANAGSVAVSGLAFAVLAAALPLLQSRSLLVMQSLGDLASVALDLVFEPSCGRDSSAQETNGRRARHLVGRLEQVREGGDANSNALLTYHVLNAFTHPSSWPKSYRWKAY
ncbi:hypothetical protein EON64_01005 [archaeon]|nr:MAG: hypothetical protein EON64_01005 [archaeon]